MLCNKQKRWLYFQKNLHHLSFACLEYNWYDVMQTQYLAFRNKVAGHHSVRQTEGAVQVLKQQWGTQAKGLSPPNHRGPTFLSLLHAECIYKYYALTKGKLHPKSFPIFLKKKFFLKSTFIPVFVGSKSFIIFSPGTLLCLNMEVYKSIWKYGILRMFQSKVKLVLKTLLAKAKITVWLNSLKCSWLQLLSTS